VSSKFVNQTNIISAKCRNLITILLSFYSLADCESLSGGLLFGELNSWLVGFGYSSALLNTVELNVAI